MRRREALLAGAAWLGAARLAFAGEQRDCECPPPEVEDPILALGPKLYLKLNELAGNPVDSAVAGYAGGLEVVGSPAARGADGIRLGPDAYVAIDQDPVFTTPGADRANTIVESEVTFSVHCAFPIPPENDWVIFAKGGTHDIERGVSLRVHKNGSVELRVREHKHRPLVQMWTRAQVVRDGGQHHFTASLGHRGAWLTVDGRPAELGFRNTMAWWGLDHRHNGVEEGGKAVSTRVTNSAPIWLGREPGQDKSADVVVSKFAVFYSGISRMSYGQRTEGLSLGDVVKLAGATGDPLLDRRFADMERAAPPGENTIQAVIDACTPNGTVVLKGDYRQTKDIVLKPGVRITSTGALVTFTNDAKVTSPMPKTMPACTGGGDLPAGAGSYRVTNNLSRDALFLVVDKTPLQNLYRVTGIHDAFVKKSDLIPIHARTDAEIVFARAPFFTYRAGTRLATLGYEPTRDVLIDGDITLRKSGGTEKNNLVTLHAVRRLSLHGVKIEQTGTNTPYLNAVVLYGCAEVAFIGCKVTTVSPQGPDGARHPYAMKIAGCAHVDIFDHTGHSNDWHAIDQEVENVDDTWGLNAAVKDAHWGGQWGDVRRSRLSTKNNNFPCICHTANHITMQDLDFLSGGGTSIDGYAHDIKAIIARPGHNTQIAHTRGVGATSIWHCQFGNKLGNWGNGKYGMTKCDYGDLHYKTPLQKSTFAPVPHDGSNSFTDVDKATSGFPF